jgi:uroporphyrinogen decarboxylase
VNSRERILANIEGDIRPDRPAIDLGGYQSGICWKAYDRLKAHMGIDSETEILERNQMLAVIDEEILRHFGVDTRYIFPAQGRASIWLDDRTYEDEWGIVWQRPRTSDYYDMVKHPWAELTAAEICKISTPRVNREVRCARLLDEARRIRKETNYALFTSLSGIFEQAWYLVGMERFFIALADDHRFVEAVLDKVLEGYLKIYSAIFEEIGEYIDCVEFWGDLGTQQGPLLSPTMYRKLVKPREEQLIAFTKKHTRAKVAWHSCGSCRPFIPDLIEIGVDVLNPVQTTAQGMERFELARDFGQDITFWGGIDGQWLLPNGNPEDVKNEVREIIDAFCGKYIISSCHNIQNDVPPENIIALFEAAYLN